MTYSSLYSLFLLLNTTFLLSMENKNLHTVYGSDENRYEGIPVAYLNLQPDNLHLLPESPATDTQTCSVANQISLSDEENEEMTHLVATTQIPHNCCTQNYSGKCFTLRCEIIKSAAFWAACCGIVKALAWATGSTPSHCCDNHNGLDCSNNYCNDLWFPISCAESCPDPVCTYCCAVLTWGNSIALGGAAASTLAACAPCPTRCIRRR